MSAQLTFDAKDQFYTYNSLSLVHLISTRHNFNQADFNLSFHTGEEALVNANRERLFSFFKGAKAMTIPKQCHGVHIHHVKDFVSSMPTDTDAVVTNVKGHVIGVLSADCVPILLYDPVKEVLGVAHAGWKGTVALIGPLLVAQMKEQYKSNPADIRAYIGPSIGLNHFEVGKEVVTYFEDLNLLDVVTQKKNQLFVDLWAANKHLLIREGLLALSIHTAEKCTFEEVKHFYSARKEGFNTGRFGVFAML